MRRGTVVLENLEKELQKWREARSAKPAVSALDARRVKVNGQEVMVVRRKARPRVVV